MCRLRSLIGLFTSVLLAAGCGSAATARYVAPCGAGCVHPVPGSSAAPWPQESGNAARTRLSDAMGPTSDHVRWTFDTTVPLYWSPAVSADGTVFVSGGATLDAIGADGTLVWSSPVTAYSAPAIAQDGTIYVSSADKALHALNSDGTPKWSFATTGRIMASPTLDADGTVWICSEDQSLYGVHPDGTLKWSRALGMPLASPAIGSDGTLYVAATDSMKAFSPDGTLLWSWRSPGELSTAAAIGSDDTIYATSEFEGPDAKGQVVTSLYALRPDGTLRWSQHLGWQDSTAPNVVTSPSIGPDGTLVVGTWGAVLAFNPDGSQRWRSGIAGGSSPPVIDAAGIVYIGAGNDRGDVFEAISADGELLWSATTNGAFWPALGADGTAYVGTRRGLLAFGR